MLFSSRFLSKSFLRTFHCSATAGCPSLPSCETLLLNDYSSSGCRLCGTQCVPFSSKLLTKSFLSTFWVTTGCQCPSLLFCETLLLNVYSNRVQAVSSPPPSSSLKVFWAVCSSSPGFCRKVFWAQRYSRLPRLAILRNPSCSTLTAAGCKL